MAVLIALAAVVIGLLAGPALAADAWLTLEHGLVSARFMATPAPQVLDVLRSAGGMDIQAPASASPTTVTLAVERMPLEHFLRRLLDALGLGGFALVYEPDGMPARLIVIDKGRGMPALASPPAKGAESEPPRRGRKGPAAAVPFLISTREARSMKLGTPGQVLVAQSPSIGKSRTGDCGGMDGEYPVQTVLITDGSTTYVTSIVVCRGEPLTPGETLGLAPVSPTEAGSKSKFTATTQ